MTRERSPRLTAITVVSALATLLAATAGIALAIPASGSLSARLAASPRPLAFGPVRGGQTASATVTVTNSGLAATAQGLRVQVSGAGYAVATDNCTGSVLAPGASCHVDVSFTPTAGGAYRGALNASAGAVQLRPLTLSGRGTAGVARLTMTPTGQAFPATSTGQRSDLVAFTVTNTGGAVSGTVSTTRPGPDFGVFADNCSGVALAPHAQCTYQVAFIPQARGPRAGTLTAAATPGGTTQASLSGTGLAAARISLTGSATFPDTNVGAQSAPITYTVVNGGDLPTGPLSRSAFTGQDFTVAADRCSGQSLAPGAACGIDVRFTPQAFGARTDVLTVSAVPGGGVNLPLSGTGLGAAHVTISPDDFTFPTTPVGSFSLIQVFRIANDGTGPIWYHSFITTSDGPGASFYGNIPPGACDTDRELDPGQSCLVAASAYLNSPGTFSGTLHAYLYSDPNNQTPDDEVEVDARLHATGS